MYPGLLLLTGCLIRADLYEQRLAELSDGDGDGFVLEDECDDQDASVHPGAIETCDGVDQDCDEEVDEGAVDATSWYLDADGDGYGSSAVTLACEQPEGHVADAGDCDDTRVEVHPGGSETWYDGEDGDCDGGDDFDADGDGDAHADFGGTDCDDDDPGVSGLTGEGWYDAGVDNDCDGEVEDQALASVADLGVRIDGEVAGGAFGTTVVTIPAGGLDDEPVVLAAAPFTEAGDVYGWRASTLGGSPRLAGAEWHITGESAADYLGYGMGWAGDPAAPIVALGAEGAVDTKGEVRVWDRDGWGGEPRLTITGEAEGGLFGGQVLSGHDHDGDGVADLVVGAPLDSRVAANSGVVHLFLDPLANGRWSATDADIVYTNRYAGALMSAASVGDVDQDGIDDLALSHKVSYDDGPGGVIVLGGSPSGERNAEDASVIQFYAAGGAYSRVHDWDLDGRPELLVASGGLERFTLPASGALYPWEDAEARLWFEDPDEAVTSVDAEVPNYGDRASFLLGSSWWNGDRGALFVTVLDWEEDSTAADGRFAVTGESAGDHFAAASATANTDGDPWTDLVIGAPDWDGTESGAGAVYVVRGPE